MPIMFAAIIADRTDRYTLAHQFRRALPVRFLLPKFYFRGFPSKVLIEKVLLEKVLL